MGKIHIPSARQIIIAVLFLFLAVMTFHLTTLRKETVSIRLHDDQIDIQKLTNAIATFIIEKGYGYKVQMVESTIKEVHERLTAGDIDITLEMWKDNNLAWYHMAETKGNVVDLGPIYTGGRQYWIIPRWYAREHNITSVFQMKQHWRDFANPEDPSKGIFFNCIFGWTCRDINRVKLKAYGLDRYFNTVAPSSPEALEAIYKNALMREVPVFGYYWEPNALVASQDWYALEEPSHSEAVWETIIRAATDPDAPEPDEACAFKEIDVHKVAHRALLEKAPDAALMLEKMQINPRIFGEVLFSNARRDITPEAFQLMALDFLKSYPDQWRPWVTDKAAKKIQSAVTAHKTERRGN